VTEHGKGIVRDMQARDVVRLYKLPPLSNCPFCGNEGAVHVAFGKVFGACPCGARGPDVEITEADAVKTIVMAIAAWNSRV
jgi:hypothetical protein